MATLMRWTPNRGLASVQDEINQLFENFWTRGSMRPELQGPWLPPVDIAEDESGFTLRVDLPGVQQKDIKLNLVGDTFTIRGERRSQRDETNEPGTLQRVERFSGVFERSFSLGAPVQADKVKASYRDGVLEIFVPKAEEARTREIQIEVGGNK